MFIEIQNTDFIEGELIGEFRYLKLESFQNTFHQVYPFVPYKKCTGIKKQV